MLALVAMLLAALLVSPLPVLDEESYLFIAHRLDPSRPYDWWRAWQPWLSEDAGNSYVYAHPPLFLWWTWLWSDWLGGRVAGPVAQLVPALKVAAALPWAALAGWSVGRLAERFTRRPGLAGAAWLAAPITLLGLQRGLMPDLMVMALSTFAVAAWVEAERTERRFWAIAGGLSLALAAWTKYPALLLVPVLLLHGRGRLRDTVPFWLSAVIPWVLGESWLWALYGAPHLPYVLAHAPQISRGPLAGRALGVATRLALGLTPLPLFVLGWRRAWPLAALLVALLVGLGAPGGTPLPRLMLLGAFGLMGVVGLGPTLRALRSGPGLLLGGWALVVLLGVVFAHNFSAPRYLLPAMAPMAILLVREAERRSLSRRLLIAGLLVQWGLALAVTQAEHRFARAAEGLARVAIDENPDGGLFTGEWSWRWRLERAGWRLWVDGARTGDLLAVPSQSSPRELTGDWEPLGEASSSDRFPLRVVCAPCGVGLYGETIGALPLGWSRGPLEEVTLWRAR